MFDLSISDAGDLELDLYDPMPDFKLSFMISEYDAQRVSFLSIPQNRAKAKVADQKISFKFSPEIRSVQLRPQTVAYNDEAIQALIIELRTELMDTYNYDIGSELYKLRHTIYTSDNSLEDIRALITEAVQQYLPGAKVTIKYADDNAAGYFFCQAIKVTIDHYGDEYVFNI